MFHAARTIPGPGPCHLPFADCHCPAGTENGSPCYTARMNTATVQPVLQRLRDRLADEPDVVLAIAFGSAAAGTSRTDSDFDLAVLADAPLATGRRQELVRLVADVTGRPVDLVDLRAAGVPVLRSVLHEGRRLVCRDRRAYEQLVSRLLADTEDFLPYRERMLKERRAAWIR